MAKINAQGTTIQTDVAVAGTPDTAIGGVVNFDGFDGEANEIDMTDLDSTAKEFTLGLIDYGSFSVDWRVDYANAGQDDIRAAALSGATKTLKVTFPDASTAQFACVIKNADRISGGVDGLVDGGFTAKITGPVTFA